MIPTLDADSASEASRLLSGLAVFIASTAAIFLLFPAPLSDVFFTGWVLFSVGLAVVGWVSARSNRVSLVWVTALLMTALAVLGMWSIGLFIAPEALCLLLAGAFLQIAGDRTAVREAVLTAPPTAPESILKTLASCMALALGGGLVYLGALNQPLFGACARETLACVLDRLHWDALGITVSGVVAFVFGGWLLWKQLYIAHTISSYG
jgi:hypothetical protein